MFNNVGKTFQVLAKILLALFWAGGVIAWIVLLATLSSRLIWIAWVVLASCGLGGWLVSLLTYSWGIVVQWHE